MKSLWVTSLVLLLAACHGVALGPASVKEDAAMPVADAAGLDAEVDAEANTADAASDAVVVATDAEAQPEAAVPFCGDGILDPDEDCDGPQNLGGMDCISMGYDEGILDCAACDFDTSGCAYNGPFCGDGVIDTNEVCDGAAHAGLDCIALGFDFGTLHCTATCLFDTSSCGNQPPPCGDGVCDWQGIETIANCPEDCGCNPVTGQGCALNEACIVEVAGGSLETVCILAGTTTYLCSPFSPCASGYVCTPQAQCAQYCDHNNLGTCTSPQTCQSYIPHNGYEWGYCLD